MRTLLFLLLLAPLAHADRPDVLVADFERDSYGDWKATGKAFGDGPARGTLPNQMAVTGFLGKGLVNSYVGGDGTTGTLTSPEFTVERKFLSFLIGGGKAEGKTCINLLVAGKVVRSATGPNDKPGGSEHLDWQSWDVAEFEGKKATIQIVDEATGGWGHINVDHIVQTDRKKAAELLAREFTIYKKHLHLPVKNKAPLKRLKFVVDGKVVRDFDIELAEEKPDFFVFADVSAFAGKKLTASATLMNDSKALAGIVASDDLPAAGELYEEKLRPRFHFTSRRGWLNDPNGLVFDGQNYHLFYQHNPYGKEWGNMHWGHAISKDLARWKEVGIGLYPKSHGDMAFSGSAVLDKQNTSGWGTKEKPPLVLAYTSTGRGECIAYSTDSGMTWTEYEKNPVVKHTGRDPKLIWHGPTKRWVMAVYTEPKGKQQIAFHTSPDLKEWTSASVIDGFFECPDLFELPLANVNKLIKKWVLYGADGKYLIGDFDGKTFTKESGKHQLWYGNFYAAQTFDNAPNRLARIQIGWAQGVTFPGMPFNQQMTVPVRLELMKTKAGIRLNAGPILPADLLGPESVAKAVELKTEPVELATGLDAAQISVEFDPTATARLRVRGLDVVYDSVKQTLSAGKVTAPLVQDGGKIRLDILVDRGSVEVFPRSGEVALSVAHIGPEKDTTLTVSGTGRIDVLTWRPIKSAWK